MTKPKKRPTVTSASRKKGVRKAAKKAVARKTAKRTGARKVVAKQKPKRAARGAASRATKTRSRTETPRPKSATKSLSAARARRGSRKVAAGGDASWSAQPSNGDWNTAANWTTQQVPTDTATFSASTVTAISFDAASQPTIDGIGFADGAPSYTFAFTAPAPNGPALTITGQGVENGSGTTQQFVVASSAVKYTQPQLKFMNATSAGGSDVAYSAGPATPSAAGGGVIGFYGQSVAGSASFTVTTGAGTPVEPSTVGGEVSFSDQSSAANGRFTVFGSTSTTDGDTFGNVVFHDKATAGNGLFTNVGGTVAKGDGGNTQFYDSASAAHGVFSNMGASVQGANGGDVAFDGIATAANGVFDNHAATASGGYGGVTSFNNNPPAVVVATQGASAGAAQFHNRGANAEGQGGGHTFFTAKYGSPTAGSGVFLNYGSAVAGSDSCAGHTVFSISLPQKASYTPNAGMGSFFNFPGLSAGAPGGYTQFAVYSNNTAAAASGTGPSAANGTFYNAGAVSKGAYGGKTEFSGNSSAASAELFATGGIGGGYGGTIAFYDQASGGNARIRLSGNGALDVRYYGLATLTIDELELGPGSVMTSLGTTTPCVNVAKKLKITTPNAGIFMVAGTGFATNTWYTILTASNMSEFSAGQFLGNILSAGSPTFRIVGNSLQVSIG